ncbi:hypothetical protein QU38_02795, partial [Staphylococcus aureus]
IIPAPAITSMIAPGSAIPGTTCSAAIGRIAAPTGAAIRTGGTTGMISAGPAAATAAADRRPSWLPWGQDSFSNPCHPRAGGAPG